jgi:hypothetical protein
MKGPRNKMATCIGWGAFCLTPCKMPGVGYLLFSRVTGHLTFRGGLPPQMPGILERGPGARLPPSDDRRHSILHTNEERWRKYSLAKSVQDIKDHVIENKQCRSHFP